MKDLFKSLWADESGQGLAEYALIIALVSIAVITLMIAFADQIGAVFSRITSALAAAPGE